MSISAFFNWGAARSKNSATLKIYSGIMFITLKTKCQKPQKIAQICIILCILIPKSHFEDNKVFLCHSQNLVMGYIVSYSSWATKQQQQNKTNLIVPMQPIYMSHVRVMEKNTSVTNYGLG